MIDKILTLVNGLPKELAVMVIASLPVSELRGAIPVGVALKEPLFKTYWLAVTGNLIPVIPLLCFLSPVSEYLRRFPLWHRFFEWLFRRTAKRASLVERYEALGLILFVAIPLPVTGAWTGCVAATLFKIRFRYAFPAILLGVLIAGVIVSTLIILGKGLI